MSRLDYIKRLKNEYRKRKVWNAQIADVNKYFSMIGEKPNLRREELEQIKGLFGPLGWRGNGEWHAWYKIVGGIRPTLYT